MRTTVTAYTSASNVPQKTADALRYCERKIAEPEQFFYVNTHTHFTAPHISAAVFFSSLALHCASLHTHTLRVPTATV